MVNLGLLSAGQRIRLLAELRARFPQGAPAAGFGGASTSDRADERWVMGGASFLAVSFLAGIAFWRRRSSS